VWGEKEWQYLGELASKDSLNINQLQTTDKTWIIQTGKASIARQLFRLEGYFEVMNKEDEHVKRAIEHFEQKK
jgi:carboxyl-terminal processing protease